MTVALLLAVALAGPPHGPVVGCGKRIEGGRPIASSLPGDLEIGPVRFTGLKFAAHASRGELTPPRGKRWKIWKSAPVVETGGTVTVAVPAAERAHLRLGWAGGEGPVVTFSPCAPGTRAFSYSGSVGSHTAWAGGFLIDGPGCRHIEVWIEGRMRPLTRAISFGAGRCP